MLNCFNYIMVDITKLTKQFKSRVKHAIQVAYKLPLLPSNQKIRELFPVADLRKGLHWIRIAEICDQMLEASGRSEEIARQERKQELLDIAQGINDVCRKYNAYTGDVDWLGRCISVRVFHSRHTLGTLRYDHENHIWSCSPSNYVNLKASSCEDAIQYMLQRRGISLAKALGVV